MRCWSVVVSSGGQAEGFGCHTGGGTASKQESQPKAPVVEPSTTSGTSTGDDSTFKTKEAAASISSPPEPAVKARMRLRPFHRPRPLQLWNLHWMHVCQFLRGPLLRVVHLVSRQGARRSAALRVSFHTTLWHAFLQAMLPIRRLVRS